MAGVQVKLTMGWHTVSSHGFTGNDPVTFQQDSVRREAPLIEPMPGTTVTCPRTSWACPGRRSTDAGADLARETKDLHLKGLMRL